MIDVLNLALPYFGLIFLGFACGKLKQHPGYRARLDEFLHRLRGAAVPVLPHPGQDAARATGATCRSSSRPRSSTFLAFAVAFAIAHCGPRATMRRGDHCRARRRLRQYRLHGAGPGARDARRAGGGAGGADLLLRQLLLFSLVPFLMALAGAEQEGRRARPRSRWSSGSSLHPFMIATALGVAVGGAAFRAAGRARPADAVPAERGGAVRAVRARRHGGAAAAARRCRGRCRSLVPIKLVAASADRAAAAVAARAVRADLGRRPRC